MTSDVAAVQVVDLAALVVPPAGGGPAVAWSTSNQLQTNVVVLPPHAHVAAHVEAALDVTLTVVAGSITVQHGPDGTAVDVTARAPSVVVLPARTRRSLTAGEQGAVYLTAHRARPGMLPVAAPT